MTARVRSRRPRSQRNPTSAARAAAANGASERSVENAKRLQRDAPDLVPAIRAGQLTQGAALSILREREHGTTETRAQLERREQADTLALQLVASLDHGLTVDRADRLIELWIKHGDGHPK